jgi:hypothetical protein
MRANHLSLLIGFGFLAGAMPVLGQTSNWSNEPPVAGGSAWPERERPPWSPPALAPL